MRVVLFLLLMMPQIGMSWNYLPHEDRPRWSFEYHFGMVHNFKLPLTISQQGYPDIYLSKAEFETEPFTSPHYWDWRFTKWFSGYGISFEAIHHKLFLKNKPTEVERFGVSHGYNMLIFNLSKSFNWFNATIGTGSVLMHPESTIRGYVYPEGAGFDWKGYVLQGWVLNLALSHQTRLYNRFYLDTELKITFSQTNVPVVLGHAKLNNIALQLIVGPGIDWGYSRKSKKNTDGM